MEREEVPFLFFLEILQQIGYNTKKIKLKGERFDPPKTSSITSLGESNYELKKYS